MDGRTMEQIPTLVVFESPLDEKGMERKREGKEREREISGVSIGDRTLLIF
jgi:hypothetical protein